MGLLNFKLFGPHRAHDIGHETNPTGTAMTVRDNDHTPWNKRHADKSCQASLYVSNGPDWVSVRLEETEQYKSGQTRTHVISMSLPRAMAEAIAAHVLNGPRDLSKEER